MPEITYKPLNNPLRGGVLMSPGSYSAPNAVNTNPFVAGTIPLDKYDAGLRRGLNQSYVRGANQSWISQVGNMAARFVPSVLSKTASGITGIGGALASPIKTLGDDESLTWSGILKDSFNAMTGMQEYESRVEKNNPIYSSRNYFEGNLVDKLATSSFWTQDFADGLEFLTSAMIPGTGLSKIGSVSKFGKLANLTNNIKNTLGLNNIKNLTGLIATGAYNTFTESLMEGKETYDRVSEELRAKFPTMSHDEISKKAADAAAGTFKWNMTVLAIPNMLESKWVFGKFGPAEARGLKELSEQAGIKYGIAQTARDFGKGVLAEGLWEENLQESIQRYESKFAKGEHSSLLKESITNTLGFLKIPFGGSQAGSEEDRGATAILLGGLLGGPFSALGGRREAKALTEQGKKAMERIKTLGELFTLSANQYVDDLSSPYKTFGRNADGSYNKLNSEGSTEYDTNKIKELEINSHLNKELSMHSIRAAVNADPLYGEYNRQRALSSLGYTIARIADQSQLSESDIDFLIDSRIDAKGTEEAKQLGTEDILKEERQIVKEYIKLYGDVKKESYSRDDFEEGEANENFNLALRRAGFYAKAMNKGISAIANKLDPMSDNNLSLSKMIEENNNLWKDILDSRNRAKLRDQYIEQIAPLFLLEKQEEEIRGKMLTERDPDSKAELADQLEDVLYRKRELNAIEGTEELKYSSSRLSQSLERTMTARFLGSRQHPSAVSGLPLKDSAAWAVGNAELAKDIPEPNTANVNSVDLQLKTILTQPIAASSAIEERIAQLDQVKTSLQNEVNDLIVSRDSPWEIFPDWDSMTAQEQEQSMSALDGEISSLTNKLGTISNSDDLLDMYYNQVEAFENYAEALRSGDSRFFEDRYLELQTAAIDGIISEYQNRLGDYDNDIATVKSQLDLINKLIRVYKNRDAQSLRDLEYKKSLLEEIFLLVQDKSNQRKAKQEKIENIKFESVVSTLINNNLFGLSDLESSELIKNALDSNSRYNYIDAWINKRISTLNDSQKIALQNSILSLLGELKNNAVEILSISQEKAAAQYRENPTAFINNKIFRFFLALGDTSFVYDKTGLYREFTRSGDIFWFIDQIDSIGYDKLGLTQEMYDRLKQFEVVHHQVLELTNVKATLESKLDYEKLLKAESEESKSADFKAPAFQQSYIIRKLLTHILIPFKKGKRYSNTLALKGWIGTGKTSIVIKKVISLLQKVSNINEDQIILTGHSESTSRQLNKIIKGKDAFVNIEDIISGALDISKAKYLFVDEAAAISNQTLLDLEAKASDNGIKMILIGDLSQNTIEDIPVMGTSLDIIHVDNLTVVYRSNVGAIVNASLAFKDKAVPVTDVTLIANKSAADIKKDNTNNIGILKAESEQELLEILSLPSSKKRVLIVNTAAEVALYGSKVHNEVVVRDFLDVQGTEYDEAYIMINPTGSHPSGIPLTTHRFNTAMYTSIGRGTKFVMLHLPTVTSTNTISDGLSTSVETAQKDFTNIAQSYFEGLNISNKIFGLNKVSAPKEISEATPAVVTATEIEEAISDSEMPEQPDIDYKDDVEDQTQEIKDIKPISGKAHRLSFPTNRWLRTGLKHLGINQAIDWSKVYIVHVLESPGVSYYYVLAREKDYQRNNAVVPVAVLSQEEIRLLGVTAEAKTYRGANRVNMFKLENIDQVAIKSFDVSNTSNLHFSYGATRQSVNLGEMLTRIYSGLFTKAKGEYDLVPSVKLFNEQGQINWAGLKDKIAVAIFRATNKDGGKDPYTLRSASISGGDYSPDLGKPYLILKDPSWESNKESRDRNPKWLYVRLNSQLYSPTAHDAFVPYMRDYWKSITDLRDNLKNLMSLLKVDDSQFNQIIRSTDNKGRTTKKEGIITQVIDSYARTMFEVRKDANNKYVIAPRQDRPLISTWVEDLKSIVDIGQVDNNELATSLDKLVNLIYGVGSGNRIVTYGEYKKMKQASKAVADFTPTQSSIASKINKLKDTLKKQKEDRELTEDDYVSLGVSDDTRVYLYKTDSNNNTAIEREYKLVRNEGPAQQALAAIASANHNLGITITKQRYDKNANKGSGASVSYRTAKPILASIRGYSKVKFLDSDNPAQLMKVVDGIIENITIHGNKYFNLSLEDAISWKSDLETKLKRIDVDNKSEIRRLLTQALTPYASDIAEAANDDALNASFINPETGETESISMLPIQDYAYEPATVEDLNKILEINGNSSNIYIPLFRNSPPGYKDQKLGLNQIGASLDQPSSRDFINNVLSTNFEFVTPTSITLDIPTEEEFNSRPPQQEPKEPALDPKLDASKYKSKVSLDSIFERIETKKNLSSELRAVINLLKTKDLSSIDVWTVEGLGNAYYSANIGQDVSKELRDKLGDRRNVILVSDVDEFINSEESIHEIIHALTKEALDAAIYFFEDLNMSEEEVLNQKLLDSYDIEFYKELKAIENKINKNNLAATTSKLDIREIIANLGNEKFNEYASKTMLKNIIDSILKWLGIGKEQELNLYNYLFTSLDKYFKQGKKEVTLQTISEFESLLKEFSEKEQKEYIELLDFESKDSLVELMQTDLLNRKLNKTISNQPASPSDLVQNGIAKQKC